MASAPTPPGIVARVLSTGDLIHSLAENTEGWNKSQLLKASLVATHWRDAFLAALWRRHSTVLTLCTIAKMNFNQLGELEWSDKHWDRWIKYSTWVRVVATNSYKTNASLSRIDRMLSVAKEKVGGQDGKPLLPALRSISLTINIAPKPIIPRLFSLASRTVSTLILYFHGREEHVAILHDIPDTFPHLLTFSLSYGASEEAGIYKKCSDSLCKLLSSLRSLHYVSLPPFSLSEDVILALAVLPRLRSLQFPKPDMGGDDSQARCAQSWAALAKAAARLRRDKTTPFQSLKSLSLYLRAESWKEFQQLFSHCRLTALDMRTPAGHVNDKRQANAHQKLMGALSKFSNLIDLRMEYYDARQEGDEDEEEGDNEAEDRGILPMDATCFRHLGKLRALKKIFLVHPINFAFGDTDIVKVSSNWRNMRILEFYEASALEDFDCNEYSPSLSIILPLLKNMSHLRELTVGFRPEIPDEEQDLSNYSVDSSRLIKFDPLLTWEGDFGGDDAEEIYDYLSPVIPARAFCVNAAENGGMNSFKRELQSLFMD